MIGTYALVVAGPGSVVITSMTSFPVFERLIVVASVFGLAVASVIVAVGKQSGANINPAVTTAATLAGGLERGMWVPYVGFQLLGSLLAGLTLKVAFGSLAPSVYLGSTKLAFGVSPAEGLILEITGTFFLALSALTASSFIRTPYGQALLVGGTLFVLILLVGPFTGASFNPARSLGPSVFSGYFDSQFVYWLGPLVGGAGAGLLFRGLR
jgi:glycerol uptake facilitator-like aquaporin